MSESTLTVGELRSRLTGLSEDTIVSFSGGLTFYRVKRWGDDEVIIEFGEAQADLAPEFKKRNPNVKVAFIDAAATDWDEKGMVGTVNVAVR